MKVGVPLTMATAVMRMMNKCYINLLGVYGIFPLRRATSSKRCSEASTGYAEVCIRYPIGRALLIVNLE